MKTIAITIISYLCTEHKQGTYCYKGKVVRPQTEWAKMSNNEKRCDTITVYSSILYKQGDILKLSK